MKLLDNYGFTPNQSRNLRSVLLGLSAILLGIACSKEVEKQKKPPIADFVFKVGEKGKVEFQNLSQYDETAKWDFGDGATSTDDSPAHTYGKDGKYVVNLTATNSDGTDIEKREVIISPDQIRANFSYQILAEGCVQFKSTSTNATALSWTFDKGAPSKSTGATPKVCFPGDGQYKVTLVASGFGASSTKEQTIKIELPKSTSLVADFTITKTGMGTYAFKNTSKNAVFSDWYVEGLSEYAKVSTATDMSFTFPSNNNFKVKLCVTGKDSGPLCVEKTVSVNDIPALNNRDRFIGRWGSTYQCTDRAYQLDLELTRKNDPAEVDVDLYRQLSAGDGRVEGDSISLLIIYSTSVRQTLKGKINTAGNVIDFQAYISDGPEPKRCIGKLIRK